MLYMLYNFLKKIKKQRSNVNRNQRYMWGIDMTLTLEKKFDREKFIKIKKNQNFFNFIFTFGNKYILIIHVSWSKFKHV